jgi:hypothetical protein
VLAGAARKRIAAVAEWIGTPPEIGHRRPCRGLPHGHRASTAFERYAVAGSAQKNDGNRKQGQKLCGRLADVSTDVL